MKKIKANLAISTIGAVFVSAILFAQNKPGAIETTPSSKLAPAPAWQLQDVDGKTVRSSDFKGKVVILDFWATWCGPCRMELPGFVELQKKYEKQGLAVIGVSVDQIGAAERFCRLGVGQHDRIIHARLLCELFHLARVEAIPTTFVIDREGRIVKQHLGFTEKEEFEKEIKPLLTP